MKRTDERDNNEEKNNNLSLIVSNLKVNQYYIGAKELSGLDTSSVIVTPANGMEQRLMNKAQPKYCEGSLFDVQAESNSISSPPPPSPPKESANQGRSLAQVYHQVK